MNGWLAKKSNNWLIQITIVCFVCILWGHALTEFFCKFSLFSIKFEKGPSIIFSLYASVQRVLFFLTPSLLHKAYCINVDTMYSIYTMIIHHFISVHVI